MDAPSSIQSISDCATPVNLVWQRIETENVCHIIRRLAASHARRSGEDADDLAQAIRLQIAERAAQDLTYLDYNDVAIVLFALRRVIDQYRRHSRDAWYGSTPFDDDWHAQAPHDGTPPMSGSDTLNRLMSGLDGETQTLVKAITDAGDSVLTQCGRLNISALARKMGQPERTTHWHVQALRRQANAVRETWAGAMCEA